MTTRKPDPFDDYDGGDWPDDDAEMIPMYAAAKTPPEKVPEKIREEYIAFLKSLEEDDDEDDDEDDE